MSNPSTDSESKKLKLPCIWCNEPRFRNDLCIGCREKVELRARRMTEQKLTGDIEVVEDVMLFLTQNVVNNNEFPSLTQIQYTELVADIWPYLFLRYQAAMTYRGTRKQTLWNIAESTIRLTMKHIFDQDSSMEQVPTLDGMKLNDLRREQLCEILDKTVADKMKTFKQSLKTSNSDNCNNVVTSSNNINNNNNNNNSNNSNNTNSNTDHSEAGKANVQNSSTNNITDNMANNTANNMTNGSNNWIEISTEFESNRRENTKENTNEEVTAMNSLSLSTNNTYVGDTSIGNKSTNTLNTINTSNTTSSTNTMNTTNTTNSTNISNSVLYSNSESNSNSNSASASNLANFGTYDIVNGNHFDNFSSINDGYSVARGSDTFSNITNRFAPYDTNYANHPNHGNHGNYSVPDDNTSHASHHVPNVSHMPGISEMPGMMDMANNLSNWSNFSLDDMWSTNEINIGNTYNWRENSCDSLFGNWNEFANASSLFNTQIQNSLDNLGNVLRDFDDTSVNVCPNNQNDNLSLFQF